VVKFAQEKKNGTILTLKLKFKRWKKWREN